MYEQAIGRVKVVPVLLTDHHTVTVYLEVEV